MAVLDPETTSGARVGVVGEIVNTTGAGGFEGYYNDEEADAERTAGGMYYSGDLGYRDEGGFFYFAGRSATGCGSTGKTWAPPR